MNEVPLACIGPITSQTVLDLGYRVAIQAAEYTVPGLVNALVEHAGSKQYA
jgi:uroporphyrinogen III methyltransferase/synthase